MAYPTRMRYRPFGRTGLMVSEVSLGGLFFGKLANGRSTEATVLLSRPYPPYRIMTGFR